MNIQRATMKDISDLIKMDASLNDYRSANFDTQQRDFHKRTKPYPLFHKDDLENSIVFIAKDSDGKALGFIRGTIGQRKHHVFSSLGYIDELFVSEDARGHGVAIQLFESLEHEFKKQGCDHMTTHTDVENLLSRAFYTKAGMNEVTVEYWKKIV